MVDRPVGLSEADIIRTLAVIEAESEINNVPPPQRQAILDKARAQLTIKQGPPGPP